MKVFIISIIALLTFIVFSSINFNSQRTNSCYSENTGESKSFIMNLFLTDVKANEIQRSSCLDGLSSCSGGSEDCNFKKRCEDGCDFKWVKFGDFDTCEGGGEIDI